MKVVFSREYTIKVGDDTLEAIFKKTNILDQTKQQETMTTLQRLINEGIKEGRNEGIKEGRKEGIKEGISSTKLQIAKNLLRQGVVMSIIQDATGFSTEQLNKLKAEL